VPEGRFRLCPHDLLPGKTMIEYWRGGKFIAGIYPHQDGIRVVSKFLTGANMEEEPAMHQGQWLPAAVIKLEV